MPDSANNLRDQIAEAISRFLDFYQEDGASLVEHTLAKFGYGSLYIDSSTTDSISIANQVLDSIQDRESGEYPGFLLLELLSEFENLIGDVDVSQIVALLSQMLDSEESAVKAEDAQGKTERLSQNASSVSTSDPHEQSLERQINVAGGIHADKGFVNLGEIHVSGDLVSGDKYVGYTSDQVSTLITQIRTTFQPKPFDGTCPYVGLASFGVEYGKLFFGREKTIKELISRVEQSRFIVIAGPSGSGKSSLVRAGLIYQLKQGGLSGSDRWLYETLKPGRNPLEKLARVTSSLAGLLNAGDDVRTKGQTDPTIFHKWVDIGLKDERSRRVILLIDQFEEIFTQTKVEAERIAFLNLLSYATEVEDGLVTVIFTLRSDFVSNCANYPQLNRLLNQQFIQVGAMEPDELVWAIAAPALHVGLPIDPDLIAQIINDMGDEPGALPLMQFALRDLFDAQHKKGGVVSLARSDYLEHGGIYKALERHADSELKRLTDLEQDLAAKVLIHLIEIGLDTHVTGRTATFDEFLTSDTKSKMVRNVINQLADARLITTDETANKETVTLAHERLIQAWPWLQQLVDESRDVIVLQNRIVEDASIWAENGFDLSYLYQDAKLAIIRTLIIDKNLNPSTISQKFLEASIVAQEKKERDRLRERQFKTRLIRSVALLLIPALVIVTNVWMFVARQNSDWQKTSFPSVNVESIAVRKALRDGTTPKICVGTSDVGIGCTPDGQTWNIYQAGLPTSRQHDLYSREYLWGYLFGGLWETDINSIESISFDQSNTRSILALINEAGLFRSEDSGSTWVPIVDSRAISTTLPITEVKKISVFGQDIQVLLNNGMRSDIDSELKGSLHASSDNGLTWAVVGGRTTETGAIRDMQLTRFDKDDVRLYVASENGIFGSKLGSDWFWQKELNVNEGEQPWAITQSDSLFYIATYSTENRTGTIYRWHPKEMPKAERWTGFKGAPKVLASAPNSNALMPLWILWPNDNVSAFCNNGLLVNYGRYPRWRWQFAHDLKVVTNEHNQLRVLVGQSNGLLEYLPESDDLAKCN
ncbi:MAG: hypothetical protein AAF702_09350 [Chloroflexota bacterium]